MINCHLGWIALWTAVVGSYCWYWGYTIGKEKTK